MSEFYKNNPTFSVFHIENNEILLISIRNLLHSSSVDNWPLMKTPLYPLSILLCYWCFVYKLGPQIMRNRRAFELRTVLIIYNAFQVTFCIWQIIRLCKVEKVFQAMKDCTFTKQQMDDLTVSSWWYFFSKVTELLDTVFFILRKKQSQITILHVYHHSFMMAFTWVYVKYIPDGQGYFLAFINTAVHVVMYSYYLISALGQEYQKYLWWKKYMTWMQLIQFGMGSVFLVHLMANGCNFPKFLMVTYIISDIVFIYLFINFYVSEYFKKNATSFNVAKSR